MKCFDLMKKDVLSLAPDDSVQEAAKLMADIEVDFLPVVNPGGQPVGTLTDRDIALRVAGFDQRASQVRVDEAMTREVIACNAYDDVEEAEQVMTENQRTRLMVTDDRGTLVGIISLSDLPHDVFAHLHGEYDRLGGGEALL